MTCVTTSDRRNRLAEPDAVSVLMRALKSVQDAYPPHDSASSRYRALWEERQRLNAEVEAIAALISAHRAEFDGYLADRAETVSLADRRRQRRRSGPKSKGSP